MRGGGGKVRVGVIIFQSFLVNFCHISCIFFPNQILQKSFFKRSHTFSELTRNNLLEFKSLIKIN